MFRKFLSTGLLLAVCYTHAADLGYSHDISKWQEASVPSRWRIGAHEAWLSAANHSRYEWSVSTRNGQLYVQLGADDHKTRQGHPIFETKNGTFNRTSAFMAVDGGWLVGFNQGEWGGALYWFSLDGSENYKISNHQIVDIFRRSDGIYAIEGVGHLEISKGSVIRISRSKPESNWQAAAFLTLPFAPYAVSMLRNDGMLITLSDSLILVDNKLRIQNLLERAPWRILNPNSSAVTQSEQKLYIGMRQFVGEFDIPTKQFRFLLPASEFMGQSPN